MDAQIGAQIGVRKNYPPYEPRDPETAEGALSPDMKYVQSNCIK